MKYQWRHKLVWLGLGFLMACSGAAPGGGAVDGGASVGGPVGGNPVGGGNFAAGPVSLPGPSMISPNNPVEWVNISCTNTVGPNFECAGSLHSVPANGAVQFAIYAPGAAVPRDSYSVQAGADGAWSVSRAGTAGESVEICPIVKGVCFGTRLLKIPPEGVSVEGNSGTMKNLSVDSQGNSWHSRLWTPLLNLGAEFASLWVPTAAAQSAPPPSYTGVSCDGGSSLNVTPYSDSKCFLYRASAADGTSVPAVTFDDCEQTDIHSIVATTSPDNSGTTVLVAVKNNLYVVDSQPTPHVTWKFGFPGEVTAIIDQGGYFLIAVKDSTPAGTLRLLGTERNLYSLDLLHNKYNAAAGCYNPMPFLQGLQSVTASDSYKGVFGAVVYLNSGQYRVVVGRNAGATALFKNDPIPIVNSANPLDVKVLKVEADSAWFAVLNSAEKKITVVKHYFPEANVLQLGGPEDEVRDVSLEGMSTGTGTLSVSKPQLLSIDRLNNDLAFVDIGEQGSKLVTLRFGVGGSGLTGLTTAAVTDLGNASPSSLHRDTATARMGWVYDGSAGTIERRRSATDEMRIQFDASGAVRAIQENPGIQFQIRTQNTGQNTGDDGEEAEIVEDPTK